MSKKCPNCGSYNTEIAIENYAERALVHAGRWTLALGAGAVAGLVSPHLTHAVGHNILESTKPDSFNGYFCCNCKKYF